MGDEKAAAPSLDDLFKKKAGAKKKFKSVNINQEKPKEQPKPPSRASQEKPAADGDGLEGWERQFNKDDQLLRSSGLWLKKMEADGACLFRAFADQILGDGGEAHSGYRERCVSFLKSHREDFEPFIEEDFDGYCRRMQEPACWGGHVEAQALAREFGVNVIIHQPSDANSVDALAQSEVEIFNFSADEARTVQLSFHPTYHAGQHYNSVRLTSDEGEGIPPHICVTELRGLLSEARLAASKAKATEEAKSTGGYGGKMTMLKMSR